MQTKDVNCIYFYRNKRGDGKCKVNTLETEEGRSSYFKMEKKFDDIFKGKRVLVPGGDCIYGNAEISEQCPCRILKELK